jgi:hypothetical protein
MSYSFVVVVKDGKAELDPVGTAIDKSADGRYVVNGHVPVEGTWQAEHIKVTRNVNDFPVIHAEGTHYKESPK